MKKLILALALIVGSIGYVFVLRGSTTQAQTPRADSATAAAETSTPATPVEKFVPAVTAPAPVASIPTPAPAPHTKPVALGTYKDGTYTGSAADAYYGYVQVAAVISGGKIVNVKVLQYPNDRSTSIEINQQALPLLIREAISAQRAQVQGISGASDTSPAFVESLASALAKAKA